MTKRKIEFHEEYRIKSTKGARSTPTLTKGSPCTRQSARQISHEKDGTQLQPQRQKLQRRSKISTSTNVVPCPLSSTTATEYHTEQECQKDNKAAMVANLALNNQDEIRRTFSTRITIKNVYKLIQHIKDIPSLTEEIRSIGFGGFLELQCSGLPHDLAYWLLSTLQAFSCSFPVCNNQTLRITPKDIHLTLGLPLGGSMVLDEKPKKGPDEDSNYKSFVKRFKKRWQINSGSISLLITHVQNLAEQNEPQAIKMEPSTLVY